MPEVTERMLLNGLNPSPLHALVEWRKRLAMAEVVGIDLSRLYDEAPRRNLGGFHRH